MCLSPLEVAANPQALTNLGKSTHTELLGTGRNAQMTLTVNYGMMFVAKAERATEQKTPSCCVEPLKE